MYSYSSLLIPPPFLIVRRPSVPALPSAAEGAEGEAFARPFVFVGAMPRVNADEGGGVARVEMVYERGRRVADDIETACAAIRFERGARVSRSARARASFSASRARSKASNASKPCLPPPPPPPKRTRATCQRPARVAHEIHRQFVFHSTHRRRADGARAVADS